ncbi:MAG: hypothetical protein COA78_28770 [Blastopirellula sp.]|nr:MAG: hypothetical protein COA78_28770 [Blastopirellula sp.]
MNDDQQNPFESPQASASATSQSSETGDATGGLIPYKNVPALISYYLGVFSIIPFIGFFLAVPAIILGVMGLQKKAKNPHVKGTAHAWVGIVMGTIFMLLWGGLLFIGFIGFAASR